MKIKVNGKEQELTERTAISRLLEINNVTSPTMVSVQLNGEFVGQTDHACTFVSEGDEVDFLYFMGGGENGGQNERS